MIEVNNLYIKAGDMLVETVKLVIPTGRCHVLLGATGNGKTVLLETIAGIRKSLSGSIQIDGNEVSALPSIYDILVMSLRNCPYFRI